MISILAVVVLGAWAMFATAMWFTAEHPRHSDPFLHGAGSGLPHEVWLTNDPALAGRHGAPVEWHRGGLEWHQVPQPPTKHICRPQSCYIDSGLVHVDRCACGGERWGVHGRWLEVNSRCQSQSRSSSGSPSGYASAPLGGRTGNSRESVWPSVRLEKRRRVQRRRRKSSPEA